MTNHPHKDGLSSMQGYGTGGTTTGNQHHADDPLSPTDAGPTAASRGAYMSKSRGPMKENTDQTAAGLLSPTVCDPPDIQAELYSQDPEVNIAPPPDSVSTCQASTEPPNQMGVDIVRSPIGNEVVYPSGRVGDTTNRPDNGSTKKDSERQKSKNRLPQPRQRARSKKALPSHNVPEQSSPPITTGGRQQLPGHAAQDLDGLCPDFNLGTLGCTEVHHTTSSTTIIQR